MTNGLGTRGSPTLFTRAPLLRDDRGGIRSRPGGTESPQPPIRVAPDGQGLHEAQDGGGHSFRIRSADDGPRGRVAHEALRRDIGGRRRHVSRGARPDRGLPRAQRGGEEHDAADPPRPRGPHCRDGDHRRAPVPGPGRSGPMRRRRAGGLDLPSRPHRPRSPAVRLPGGGPGERARPGRPRARRPPRRRRSTRRELFPGHAPAPCAGLRAARGAAGARPGRAGERARSQGHPLVARPPPGRRRRRPDHPGLEPRPGRGGADGRTTWSSSTVAAWSPRARSRD